MQKPRAIMVCFLRQNGQRDSTTLEHYTLGEARDLVCRALRSPGVPYTEADICIGSVYTKRSPGRLLRDRWSSFLP